MVGIISSRMHTLVNRSLKRSWFSWGVRCLLLIVLGVTLAPPAAYAQEDVHVVGRGENLATIANAYGVSVQALINSNGLSNPNFIYVGQRLVIPGSTVSTSETASTATTVISDDGYYTVRRGDTLSQIAANSGMMPDDLLRLNGLSNANFVWVGQRLRVTARVAAVAEETTKSTPQLADSIYVVKVGDTLSSIAQANGTTMQELLVANGLPNANFVWVGQRLRVGTADSTDVATSDESATTANTDDAAAAAPVDGIRWIEVNLTKQMLTAWQGDVAVMDTKISSGVSATPTVTGRFKIYTKYSSQRMIGPGYDLPNVPWVMYFFSNYAIHGAYWHNNFGTPMSHGCVNMRSGEAKILYDWASVGTEVYVHF